MYINIDISHVVFKILRMRTRIFPGDYNLGEMNRAKVNYKFEFRRPNLRYKNTIRDKKLKIIFWKMQSLNVLFLWNRLVYDLMDYFILNQI